MPAGRSVKLACTVKDLGTYKVSIKSSSTPLSYNLHLICIQIFKFAQKRRNPHKYPHALNRLSSACARARAIFPRTARAKRGARKSKPARARKCARPQSFRSDGKSRALATLDFNETLQWIAFIKTRRARGWGKKKLPRLARGFENAEIELYALQTRAWIPMTVRFNRWKESALGCACTLTHTDRHTCVLGRGGAENWIGPCGFGGLPGDARRRWFFFPPLVLWLARSPRVHLRPREIFGDKSESATDRVRARAGWFEWSGSSGFSG